MAEFDRKQFGENLRKCRKSKNVKQETIAKALGKTKATISKYENGELLMDAEGINKVCEELEIYSTDLFESNYRVQDIEHSKNPFNTNKIYVYFNAFDYRTKKFKKDIYRIDIIEKPDRVRVDFVDIKDNKAYLTGYMLCDNVVCFMSFENYKGNANRLEVSVITININNGTKGLMMGTYCATNGQYIPSIRKCYFSKKKVDFTDEMLEDLKPTEDEIEKLKETNALYLDIFSK